MSRALITIKSTADRARATQLLTRVPYGTRIEFKSSKRSTPQNSRLWACLTDIASQVEWHGRRLKAPEWKLIFMDALNRELNMVPNLDGTGFVNLGRSSSDLSKQEMGDLLELIQMFGAQHGVKFGDEQEDAHATAAA